MEPQYQNVHVLGNVKRPVDHQSTVVLNARAVPNLASDRTRDMSGSIGTENKYYNPSSDGGAIYGVGKHEFAFREIHKQDYSHFPNQFTHGSDLEVWTSFNNYRLHRDIAEWPQLVGIVDTEAVVDEQFAPTRRDDVVVAIKGPRSTVHTGDTPIQAMDLVLALPPQSRVENSICLPVRGPWKGKDPHKFLAETVGFSAYYNFDVEKLIRDISTKDFNLNLLRELLHHSLIHILEYAIEDVDKAIANRTVQAANKDISLFWKVHKTLDTLRQRNVAGRCMQTAQYLGQLDINLN